MIRFNDYKIQKFSNIKLEDLLLYTEDYYPRDREDSLYIDQEYMRQTLDDLSTYLNRFRNDY